MKTIVRLFDDVSIARDAIQDLVADGFDRQEITLMAYDPYGDYRSYLDRSEIPGDIGEETAAGAGIGSRQCSRQISSGTRLNSSSLM